jgi:hypothetical protein
MRKLLQTAIIGIALVCANSAHAATLRVVLSKQIELGGACHDTTDTIRSNPGTMCVITGLGGSFQGEGEFGALKEEANGNWVFHGHSCQPRTFFVVTCLRAD